MKNTALILVILSVLSLNSLALNAHDRVTADVREYITYPEHARENRIQGDVYILFTVNENGEAEVMDVRASDDTLLQYVVQRISELRWKPNESKPEHNYAMRLSFRIC